MKTTITANAHGRVNLIGEHTDYNGGFVLPTLIRQSTTVHANPRKDFEVSVKSEGLGEFKYQLGEEKSEKHWGDYIRGVTRILAQSGHNLRGMDLAISSTVPVGSGLSSSAALNVALMRAMREMFALDLPDKAIPKLCQQVENEFVGARVGIMDPMACALAKEGFALFVDTRDFSTRNIPIPEDAELAVIHSGVSHQNVGGGYNERRAQCEDSARIMGVSSLRDLDPSPGQGAPLTELLARCEAKLSPVQFRRVRHVLTENKRVLDCIQAFTDGDLAKAGFLFDESHRSLREDYEVTIPETDCLVECVRAQSGVFGARMTGGGFGGSIVALVKKGHAAEAARAGARAYQEKTGQKPTVLT
jgi:galactokinase